METIELLIGRDDVLAEVDKATDYTGSKMGGEDGEVRDRIAMTEEDMENLQRFWEESASLAMKTYSDDNELNLVCMLKHL